VPPNERERGRRRSGEGTSEIRELGTDNGKIRIEGEEKFHMSTREVKRA
jgi:hypothetical protein